ncbi:MAG: hypothetical protein U0J62_09775 [Lachnospiraceae bacterium]|nr:hypothetical protein [Lachnospiraceae bacterium]
MKMKRTLKRLDATKAKLYSIAAGRRKHIADFTGEIAIVEHQSMVPILGQVCKGEKKIYASFMMCDDIDYCMEETYHSGKVYEAICTVTGEEQSERLHFAGMRFEDMNPVDGKVTFEITDLELIRKMLMM